MKKTDWILAAPANALETDCQFWDQISQTAYPLTKGAMRIPISLEPFTLNKNEYSTLENDLTTLMDAAKKIADAYFTDEKIAEIIAVDESERELILASKARDFVGIVRTDLFYSNTIKIVEINADYPDGFFMHAVTARAIQKSLPSTINLSPTKSHAEIFSNLLTEQGIDKKAHVFIGYDKERAFIDEFYLAKIELAKLGWSNVSVGAFEDLIFESSSLYFNKQKIDAIRRGSELSKIRKIPNLVANLLEAEKNGLIVINNFKMRLLGYKSLLAVLWDDTSLKYLDEKEITVVRKLVPETYKLDSQKINHARLIKEKNMWVLKPTDLAEGSDVFVGAFCGEADWANAIERAYLKPNKWIVQHKVTIPESTFNLIEDNHSKITSYTRKFDSNPHIIMSKKKTELGTILVRFSESSVLNVAKGGGITYVFPTI